MFSLVITSGLCIFISAVDHERLKIGLRTVEN